MSQLWQPFALIYLGLAGLWLGAMSYSLGVVQPRVARFFTDQRQREEFLTSLAHGNRWPVVALIGSLTVAAVGVLVTGSALALTIGYSLALLLHLAAAAVFGHVSWRHWPARVFALPAELPGYQVRLRRLAWSMLGLVGAAFGAALVASLWR